MIILNSRGLGDAIDYPPCPSGFSVGSLKDYSGKPLCINAGGFTPSNVAITNAQAAVAASAAGTGYLALGGAALVLFLAPGAAKLLAVPLILVAFDDLVRKQIGGL